MTEPLTLNDYKNKFFQGTTEYDFYKEAADSGVAADKILELAGKSVVPLIKAYSGGNIPFANTGSAAWFDLPGGITDEADVTLENVEAGDWVSLFMSGLVQTAAFAYITMRSLVAGAPVNNIGPGALIGPHAWVVPGQSTGSVYGFGGWIDYQLQAGDIENGDVTFRPYYMSTAARNLFATAATPFVTGIKGPF